MKNLTTTLAIIAILLLSFISCDKYHRNRYTGIWDFVTVTKTEKLLRNDGTILSVEYDTVYYLGSISEGEDKSVLIIKYTENDEMSYSLKKDRRKYDPARDGEGALIRDSYIQFDGEDKVRLGRRWVEINDENSYYEKESNVKGTKKTTN